jgi:orotate phosphoribosyltransferase
LSELGKALLKINAFKVGTFSTKLAKVSPYFIDLRKLSSYPEAFELASHCLLSSLSEIERERESSFDSICGIPISGLLLAGAVAWRLRRPLVYPVPKENRIQGFLRPGSQTLVVEDVSETGESLKAAVQAIRATGGIVEVALSLIDRKEEAKGLLGSLGVELYSFTTTTELVSTLKQMMALSEDDEKAIESKPEAFP